MKPAETVPPPLPRSNASRPLRQVAQSLALLLGLMVLARVALHFQLPLPGCPLREWTGVPCPFCGSTRAFAAMAGLDLVAALRLNPLVSFAALTAGVFWLWALVRGFDPAGRLRQRLGRGAVWRWLLSVALLLNWLYLLFWLPR